MEGIDLAILVAYTLGIVLFGSWFVRRSRTPDAFMRASGAIPSWAVGFSLFGTYLSANTFLGNPGKAFGSDWNSFVFSLSLPVAALVATKVFVPFYRRSGEISAYTHLEARFGRWARTYATVCYLLTQLARIGAILLGVALALGPLTGRPPRDIILASGFLVTLYTLLGGIEAVIWTDVVQSILLIGGALATVVLLLTGMPEGPTQLFAVAWEANKFGLGSTSFDLTSSTVWVVLLYGLFINLNNFGIDQSYVQRYHAARTTREAERSVWMACLLYVPASLLFFFIGTGLFAYYETQPAKRAALVEEATALAGVEGAPIADRAFPHFIANELPTGASGLILAALFAAAMSSVDTSLNSSATVVLSDLYRAYVDPGPSDRRSMRVLELATLAVGILGTGSALAMIGVGSLLDAWWTLSGIFAGGMLGLFLLGFFSRADRSAAVAGVAAGLVVIFWMTFSPGLAEGSPLRSALHANLIIVFGTLTILFVGGSATALRARRARRAH